MGETRSTLEEAFRHNAWATRTLLAFCADVPAEQLGRARTSPLAATTGSVLETFHHVVCTEGGYLGALTGRRPAWADESAPIPPLQEMAARATEAEGLWLELVSQADDAERVVHLDAGTYETRAGVVIAQALHHGTAHREQICAILRELGWEPPEVQVWDFADATGRSRWVRSD